MKVFIRSAACVSPQKTFNNPAFLNELVEYNSNRLTCVEPDYDDFIDPKLSRRMSRIIKMSVASALFCLKNSQIDKPEAIVTGTALGCLEDTGTFLTNMVEYDEEPLSPVAFVQATHNTIGAQIALLLKCNGYNNTFVNGGISFENALIDAVMLLEEGKSKVLVGAMDEITDMSYAILSRTGMYRRTVVSNRSLFEPDARGTIAGEGSSFFLLTNKPGKDDIACIDAVSTFYKPDGVSEAINRIRSFLITQSINSEDIDLLVLGNNGDAKNDEVYSQIKQALFRDVPSVNYKHLCGEYPVSSAFAVWMSANMVEANQVPAVLDFKGGVKEKIRSVLIYNHYQNVHHSLILISAC